ncbi:unnamed protein product (macronuclear) [Paramecium tetraurelia]|uniref:Clathrin heavy chain n=1 Tax=Paramecium tetraurelia TaxID=5888 RepID=A0CY10_PARTE|nr:uncharacterized protein GSPATT00011309001 [Paramecium tetraurelia]CAK75677.1 unnamed protein product [Paramecium tetraurelia]|eukprot:XP_001443074.1 hypothetical protein (macronuclear) [Paramecium tetraurelia strain d4-2]
MNPLRPIRVQEAYRFSQLGVSQTNFKFGQIFFESDKYITIRETAPNGDTQLLQFNFETKQLISQKNIIALRAAGEQPNSTVIQIFNLDEKQRIKNVELNETIVFWRWVNPQKLAYVTPTAVYHINITNPNEQQVKVMDRYPLSSENPVQIIGYGLEGNEKWCALYGISTPDGGRTINGHIQLFLIEQARQQILEGHCCCFGDALIHTDDYKSSLFCFVERKSGETTSRLHISEIGVPPNGFQKYKRQVEVQTDPNYPTDFPVLMHINQRYGLIYVISKYSFLTVYELSTASLIFRERICNENVFVGAPNINQGQYHIIGKEGIVYTISVNDDQLVSYLINTCRHIPEVIQLGFRLASRYKLPGADNMFVDQFNKAILSGDALSAAKIAASAPGTVLRNPESIAKFKQMQQQPGQPQPLIVYFQTLLEKGTLNKFEAIELCGPILQQGRKQFVEQWIAQNKLEPSDELGDLLKKYDVNLAIQIYKLSKSYQKLAQCYMETGQIELAMQLQQQFGVSTDYMAMLRNMMMQSPEQALAMAKSLYQRDQSINVHQIAELFEQFQRLPEMTAFLVECMKNNRAEDGPLQTKVLCLNLQAAAQVADAILSMNIWTQFDRIRVAQLCEQKGLYQRALENYSDPKDVKRVILNTHALPPEFLINFLSRVDPALTLQCLSDLLRHNRQNLQVVVNVAVQNNQRLTIPACIKVFESVSAFEGVYLFLGSLINTTSDKDIYYKYIEAAAKCNQIKELERVITEKGDCYDADKVKNYLKEQKLSDPRPLIFLCDMNGFVDELTRYLYKNGFTRYIEIYIFKVNPNAAPGVFGTLIDLECDEVYLKQLLYNIRGMCPIEPTVDEFEKRNKLRVLEQWLEARVTEGNQIPAIHNALAKIKIDTSQDPDGFLINNQFYDAKAVGKFCEERDPQLAVLAYKRAWGQCDQELINLTNKNEMYRVQAKYLVERQDVDLWAGVLQETNPHRKNLIDYVIQALQDSKNVDEVQAAVKAFVLAKIPYELLGLLEKLVLHNPEFMQYKQLQNLLIITAIQSDTSKVLDYINRLDKFDPQIIAQHCLNEEYNLFEEAYAVFKKFNLHIDAVNVLLRNLGSIPRAHEYAQYASSPEVWSLLAEAYLNQGQTNESIDCYIKANDSSAFLNIINVAEQEEKYELLVKYLLMCRQTVKDVNIDNSLIYCYAKLDKNLDIESLIQSSNSADVIKVGERCYDQQLYEAAKILFTALKNNARIASCLVRLKQFNKAIEAAQKANTSKTWKELCFACVEASEFKYASIAAQNIIIVPDMLESLIKQYEEYNAQEEMMILLENALGMQRAHVGIFTELAVLYCHYKQKKVMEHCRQYFQKMNILKVLRTCEKMCLWSEAVYLHQHYDQPDNAINIMIEHSPTAFSHDVLVMLLQKITNTDLYYKCILFYLEEQPEQINDLLRSIQSKIDLSKFVKLMKNTGYLALTLPFLQQIQNANNKDVNDALNQLYLDIEDYENLRESVKNYENFDQLALAQKTQSHELVEFRRIAAYLYRKIQKYDLSMNLSKQDQMYRDSVETAQESQNVKLVYELLEFFIQNKESEFFTVCLYTCYDLLKPDQVMELTWRSGLMEFAMPYFIQITWELTHKIEYVQKKHEDREKKEIQTAQQQQSQALPIAQDFLLNQGQLMLGPPSQMNNSNISFGQPSGFTNSQMNQAPMGYGGQQFGSYQPPGF